MSTTDQVLPAPRAPVESRVNPVCTIRDPRRHLSRALALVLALLVLPPIAMLIVGSAVETAPDGSFLKWSAKYYAALVANPNLTASLANSILFSAGSALLALVTGGSIAWIVERTDTPFKSLAYLTAVITMGTPFVLYVIAWLFVLGRVGPVNEIYRALTGDSGNLFEVHSMLGMILIEGFHFAPLVFLLLAATFRASNADLEEAARMSGAGVLTTIYHISLKLALPAILAVVLLVFIRALEAFEVPALVGLPGRVSVLTTDIFKSSRQIPPDLGYSSAFSVLLLVIVCVLFSLYGRLSKTAERYCTVTGKGFRPRPFALGRGRWIAAAFLILNFVVLLVVPFGAVLWMAVTPYLQSITPASLASVSLRNFSAVLADPQYLTHAANTLLVGAGAATAIMLLVAGAGWIAARRGPLAWVLDQLAMMPLIFPGIVLGVAVMLIFLNVPLPIYGTLWVILIAYIIKFMPYGMRYVYSAVLQIHRELEESANVAGAGMLTLLGRVVSPLLAPALVAGWLFIFLVATRELAIAILLSSPDAQVLAVVMYDLWSGGQAGELAALGVVWTLVMATIALVFFAWSRRQGADAFAQ